MKRKTKIICTIGPASWEDGTLCRLIEAGMQVARINFSHGTRETQKRAIDAVRKAGKSCGAPVAIMADIQGPRLRAGVLPEGGMALEEGARAVLCPMDPAGAYRDGTFRIPISHPALARNILPGAKVFFSDGEIELKVDSVSGGDVICTVVKGGTLLSNKGMNLPGTTVAMDTVTGKDIEDLRFGIGEGIDIVAVSFVRSGGDLEPVRREAARAGKRIPVVSKIERREAVHGIDGIIPASDGIMVARGDLGVETSLEEIPHIQKMIIRKCNLAGKPVITATQMLESMVRNSRPTRAEATDVANAILDGTDAVMLSSETSVGKYPVEAVRMMASIAEKAEKELVSSWKRDDVLSCAGISDADAVAHAACQAAADLGLRLIVAFTESGSTARLLAKYRPAARIAAFTPREDTMKALLLSWGVESCLAHEVNTTDEMLELAADMALRKKLAVERETIVIVAGIPPKTEGITNLVKIHHLV